LFFFAAASLEIAQKKSVGKKKARQCCGGRPFVRSEIKSGQHPARSCGAMVVMMPDCARCCLYGHERSV